MTLLTRRRLFLITLCATAASGAETVGSWTDRVAGHASRFAERVSGLVTVETLVQRGYDLPPHKRFAIGRDADTIYAQYLIHELISEYSIGAMTDGVLVERREIVSLDGKPLQTRQAAQQALARKATGGGAAARKETLQRLAALGLVDVATEYGLLLLAFTPQGQTRIEWSPAGSALVGTEETLVFRWRQTAGGSLEFLKGKTTVRPMHGSLWVRKSDGAPLRVQARIEHPEGRRMIRDDASVDFELNRALDCVVPASVVHRHYVDDFLLTENLYRYDTFHLFTTDSKIEFRRPVTSPPK